MRQRIATAESGIVLIFALILLILISFIASMAIQRATSGEQVSKALRTHTVAFQAAETALRFCEDQVLKTSTVVSGKNVLVPSPYPMDGSAPALWSTRTNWDLAAGKAVAIDSTLINSKDSAARKLPTEVLPRCMVERMRLDSDEGAEVDAFLITAIGFSADYHQTTSASPPDAGGEVWLQSTVTRRR
jgi:type IV pilus assembly protein PilX